ncbi:MAG: DNA-binding protein [Prevotella sp.]|nr:DNA-binding protein [Prevotella sp.]
MALKLNLYQDRRSESDNYGKVYARVSNANPVGINELAKHMNKHGTPYTRGVIIGVLSDMVGCIREMILEGQPVKLGDLCIFKASVESSCANTAADFDIAKNIKNVKLLAQATGEMMRASLSEDATLEYTTLAQKVREGKVDIATLYDSEAGGGSGSGSGDDDINPQRP